MARKKSVAQSNIRQAEKSVKDIQKRAKQLLKRAQLDVREFRKELSNLKKAGIAYKRKDIRKQRVTRYSLSKIKKFKGVAVGTEMAVPARKLSAHRLRELVESGRGKLQDNFFIRPKTAAKQRMDIYKDHIRTVTDLGFGEEQIIYLRPDFFDFNEFLDWADENSDMLQQLKGPHDQFGFQIFGHNSAIGFPFMGHKGDHKFHSLVAYLNTYTHILQNPHSARTAIQEFVLIRFKRGRKNMGPIMEPYHGKKLYSKRKENRREKEQRRLYALENNRNRVNRYRNNQTKEEKERRLAKQREYDKAHSNDRREKRMSKRKDIN